MLIWGWGRTSRSRQLDAAQALFVNFGYLSLLGLVVAVVAFVAFSAALPRS